MKKLLPLLLLASVFYAAWFYWQRYADRPLQEQFLPITAEAVQSVTVQPPNREQPFTLTRTENGWVVARPPQQLLDQSYKAEELVRQLTSLKTDSVGYSSPIAEGISVTIISTDARSDKFTLYQYADGKTMATVAATGDRYYLNPASSSGVLPQLRFDHFREPRLLNLTAEQVDSVVVSYHDSLLWTTDTANLALLVQHLLAPAPTTFGTPYADFFDEIAHRDRYYADFDFYFAGKPYRVQAFQDSLWPQPYVLVGEDFPRRYLGFMQIHVDSLK